MIFAFFSLAIAAAFFASSLILLNYGRHLGLAIPAAENRCREHVRAHHRRGRRVRPDRAALGIHDFGASSGSTNADKWLFRRQCCQHGPTVLRCSKVMSVTNLQTKLQRL
jgi:hypothetical protein